MNGRIAEAMLRVTVADCSIRIYQPACMGRRQHFLGRADAKDSLPGSYGKFSTRLAYAETLNRALRERRLGTDT